MLRIYLDWNCITHLKKTENRELFDYILSNKQYFIFPFSPAHFEDLQRSRPSEGNENEDYYRDLNTLHDICETHLIMFDNAKKRVLPFLATPYEYAKKSGDTLDDILKYDSFTEYITKEIGEPFSAIFDKQLEKMPTKSNIPLFPNEVIKNGADLLNQGFKYMKEVQTRVNYNKELSAGIRDFDALSFKRISGATPDNIHEEIDKMISKSAPLFNMDKLIELTLQSNTQKSDLTKFVSYYLSYDFMGFKQDRGHDLRNITTDAKHAYYGSYCDVLVTNDRRMAGKAKAVYKDMKISTKVISSKGLKQYISENTARQFSLKPYIMELGSNIHFKDAYQPGDAHCRYSYFNSPFLGFFNYGMAIYDIDTHIPYFVFQRRLLDHDMIFFTEIGKLQSLITSLLQLDTSAYNAICNFFDNIKQEKPVSCYAQIKKWRFTLLQDSESLGIPSLVISHTKRKS